MSALEKIVMSPSSSRGGLPGGSPAQAPPSSQACGGMPADQNLDFALDSPSKRVSVITQTPKKNRIEVANSNTPPVHDQQHGEGDVHGQHVLPIVPVDSPTPLVHDQQHGKGDDVQSVEQVEFTAGCIRNGNWYKIIENVVFLKSYFFILPGDKPVQLRTSCDCTMDVVLQTFLIPTYNLAMLNPVVTYRGVLVEPHLLLSQFEDKALFILVDGPVPDYLLGHQGKLLQCLDCGMATNDNQKFAKNIKKYPTNLVPWHLPDFLGQKP